MTRASSVLISLTAALLSTLAAAEETAPAPAATTATPAAAEPTSTTTSATEAAPTATAAEAVSTAKAEAQAPSAVELATATADPVICKTVAVTGSRVRKTKTCMPASKWQAAMEAAQKMMKDNDRKSSPQAGGEQLLGR